jgi:hypothetical protein
LPNFIEGVAMILVLEISLDAVENTPNGAETSACLLRDLIEGEALQAEFEHLAWQRLQRSHDLIHFVRQGGCLGRGGSFCKCFAV